MICLSYLFENIGSDKSGAGTLGYGSADLGDITREYVGDNIKRRFRVRKPNLIIVKSNPNAMGRYEASAKIAKIFGDAGIVGGLHAQKTDMKKS